MSQDSSETARNMISMEEYLKRRQAVVQPEHILPAESAKETVTALKLAELLYV
ncbi:MAG TPA: hypothetical protein H9722_07410 [Candidatus Mediterraneibacter pullistercoris]|nr:hypothetical protein [Candidatus Mediterraneibacter pullistercoris]